MRPKLSLEPRTSVSVSLKNTLVRNAFAGLVTLAGVFGVTTNLGTGIPSFTNVATTASGHAGGDIAINRSADGGFAWGDINADGCLDLVVNSKGKSPGTRVFWSDCDADNPVFTDVTASKCTDCDNSSKSDETERSCILADVNHDGYVDLITGGNELLQVFQNSGPPNYSFGTADFNITSIPGGTNFEGVFLADYDNNGWLDIILENHNYGIDIYSNPGDGSFSFAYTDPATSGLPTSATDGDYGTCLDYDNDGDVDIIARKRNENDFFVNQGDGTFNGGQDIGDANNSNKGGVVFADFDNDGDYDLYWTDNDTDQIWVNNGGTLQPTLSGSYGEPWLSSGVAPPSNNDGCAVGDINNDGKVDLFVSASSGTSYLFINNTPDGGTLSFTQNNYNINANGNAEGASFGDYDNDGDLDLYINISSQPNQLWRNELDDENYLFVEPQIDLGSGVYRAAIGANIVLKDCDGKVISGIREVPTVSGHGTDAPDRVHFGLPNGPDVAYNVLVTFVTVNGSRKSVERSMVPSETGGHLIVIRDTDPDDIASCGNADSDKDGIADTEDVDDDNDGIPDWQEVGCSSAADFGTGTCPDPMEMSSSGVPNYKDASFCAGGSLVNGVCPELDRDGDGVPNFIDLDSDNDGVPDIVEAGGRDEDGDGRVECEATTGVFSAKLTVTDNEGDTASIIQSIHVGSPVSGGSGSGNASPTAAFAATPTSGTSPLTVSFDASGSSDSDGSISNYSWDFGDGESGTGVAPSHSFGEGSFTVTLTVTDNEGATNATTTSVTVKSPRVTDGLLVLYDFSDGSGSTVSDLSGNGTALDLTIEDPGNVTWNSNSLTLNSETRLISSSAASKVITACKVSGEVSLEAWVVPANTTQNGPARILSVSSGAYYRNFTLGQSGNKYATRLRTSTNPDNGMPDINTGSNTLQTSLQHVVFTRSSSGTTTTYINGMPQQTGSRGGNFSNWDNNFKLIIGNEIVDSRDWLGEIYLAAVYSKALSQSEVTQNYNVGATYSVNGGTSGSSSFTWNEDFDLADNTTSDNGSTAWTTSYAGSNTFKVESSAFKMNDLDAEGTWTSESIDISSVSSVDVSIDIQSQGGLEVDDYIKVYYSLDGGSQTVIAERFDNFNSDATETLTVPGLSGSSLQIIVKAYNTSSDEIYYLDNVSISGNGSANRAPVPSFTFTSTDGFKFSFDASGSSDGDGSISNYSWTFGDGSSGSGVNVSHTYVPSGLQDNDSDGFCDTYDNIAGAVTDGTALGIPDTDGDQIPNYLDLDSDNDGIADIVEAGGADDNNDGMVDPYDHASGNFEALGSSQDYDLDGFVDWYDADPDNDTTTADQPGNALLRTTG
ncbi:MAG: PKD domain-containing protein, partial [Bacteroidota bacterium]